MPSLEEDLFVLACVLAIITKIVATKNSVMGKVIIMCRLLKPVKLKHIESSSLVTSLCTCLLEGPPWNVTEDKIQE